MATKQAFVYSGSWSDETRAQPVLKFLEWYTTTIIDEKKFDLSPTDAGMTKDWVLQKSTGEVIEGADKAWPALKEAYAPFKEHVHAPTFVVQWETENGWSMVGVANLWWKLQADGNDVIKGHGGKMWDGVTPGAFRFDFTKSEHGHEGIALTRTEIYDDPTQAVVKMLQRGMLKPEQLMQS
ncbi:hypothetical protein BAUCODRAFT_36583 [Baudoinia panamericana UAMH 10762]|uniref:SnoaL-like domain-containing protein n=1 Tax=Baudoinia panamericana (strain UAMH 10762) TaxID=717646 RepID=M2N509_BAUPA|nr:uncharacterized protein BAUCODRAFT_36583 [Baudoinia panamericana UAMH 10762]EMC94109.1 hypothetical protein BAUCODRAFT_36583 [Baudoinia panamericana UAMH 10762]